MILDSQNTSSDPLRAQVGQFHRKARVIVLAMLASIVMYMIVGLVVVGLKEAGSGLEQPPLSFITLVAFLALASTALRRTQFRQMRLQAVAGARGIDGLLRHLMTMTIASAAIAETIGVLALLVSFFGGGQFYVIIFSVVALVVVLSSYPRRAAWEKIVEYYAATMPG
ncbi:MAG TPA: hypothetical protein VNO14_05450 [Blastocatellia bacterium]|nr:hypothetical protein [Blastocatellia bacterium]